MDLTDDLLMEILLRLPAKSLIRFKSVCKKWRSLISSDYLCHHHTLRHPRPQSSLILQTMEDRDPFFYFDGEKTIIPYNKGESFGVPDTRTHIVQACNGLLLLEAKYMEENVYDDLTTHPFIPGSDLIMSFYDEGEGVTITRIYFVYNPTTRQSREISFTHMHDYPRVAAVSLAFDPSISPFYKIVCIRSTERPDPNSNCFRFQVEVYNSESRSWIVSLEAVTVPPWVSFFPSGVHWNNSIYWSLGKKYFCFDIANNEMRELHFPQTPDTGRGVKGYRHYPHLQESNGRLYHFETIWESSNDDKGVFALYNSVESVAVWELEGNNEWLFKYRHTLGDGKGIVSRNLITLMVRSDGDGDGDETCCLLMYTWSCRMKSYNFLDKTYEDLFNFERYIDFVLGFQFGEVLALV